MDRKTALEEFFSDRCRCGRTKRSEQSFCYHCWRQLPRDYQRALYRLLGRGYEDAYGRAVALLYNEAVAGQSLGSREVEAEEEG